MNTQLKILLYILLVFGILYFLQTKYSLFDISFENPIVEFKNDEIKENEQESSLEIINKDGQKIFVSLEIADTQELRGQGLSGRKELGDYQGMLFIFDTQGDYSFWMKDMLISLDIIYINYAGYIVDIKKDLPPCGENECISFKSEKPFKYALEVKSGFSDLNMIEIGNAVLFNISSLK